MPPYYGGPQGGSGLVDVNASGLLADRPAIGDVEEDFVYFATDTGEGFVARGGAWVEVISPPITDHGQLSGLGDDDHPDYTTTAQAQALVDVHTGDTVDAHDAAAVSFDPTGLSNVTGTDVQTAIEELDAAGSGSAAELLAVATMSGTNRDTSSSTLTAINGAIDAITFIAPDTGKVLVELEGEANNSNLGWNLEWGLVDGAGATVHAARQIFVQQSAGTANLTNDTGEYVSASFLVTGLTPGNSYTYRWAHSRNGNTGRTRPRMMRVRRAPL